MGNKRYSLKSKLNRYMLPESVTVIQAGRCAERHQTEAIILNLMMMAKRRITAMRLDVATRRVVPIFSRPRDGYAGALLSPLLPCTTLNPQWLEEGERSWGFP
jgi:hypothetical protein